MGIALWVGVCVAVWTVPAKAVDVSAPAILQWFDSSYGTQEKRVADFFRAGYGQTWIPPTGRADSGNLSVGYDVFNRFDLGSTNNPTLYGTETGLRRFASTMHRAAGDVVVDLVWNHNGFSNQGTSGFAAKGGYPGFVLSAPGAVDGDFHGAFESGDLNGRLSGLIDIKHEMNLQYIRTPVVAGDSRNIPAGKTTNIPSAANARFYPDRNLPSTTLYNPKTGQNATLYQFNTADPTAGDAVPENATGLLMRNARWLINDVGVDGFRLDAARHFEPWVMNYFDEAVYRASTRTLLNGAPREVFSFSESASTDRANLMSQFVRKDIGVIPAGQIGGNRDALDFAQFWPLKNNPSSTGTANDFRSMVYAGLDVYDDGKVNGSSGVVFVQSHDDFGPDMMNVAYAFSLMRPGNAIVYYNAYEFYDPARTFPKPGRGDALGNFGGTVTTLVDLRNRYGRGDYRERTVEKDNYAFERSNAALVMLSNRNDAGFDARSLAVDFTLGARLVELTGNAARANATLGAGTIPEVLEVVGTASSRFVNGRFLRNNGRDQGYLVYGLPTPRSAAGLEFSGTGVGPVIAGDTPPGFVGGETAAQTAAIQIANAKARLSEMQVITGDTFTVRLATQAVTLSGGYRDRSADGDQAVLRINEGLDLNGNGRVDVVTPGDVSYGFEEFTTTRRPGYAQADGNGLYEQAVDARLLPEGMNFLTARAYRQRGDGGPAVFTEFKEVLYVDRLKPEAAFAQFKPFSGGTGNNDVWIKSTDGTADRVNIFQNIPAAVSDATILSWVAAGQGTTDKIDRDVFKTGFFGVANGNNTYTVVTREITGTYNVQRFTGRNPSSARGAGIGDLNFDGVRDGGDMAGTTYGFERILYSKNAEFNPAADATADGLVNTWDLVQLRGLLTGSANTAAANALAGVTFRRLNFVSDSAVNETDLAVLRAYVGMPGTADVWTYDLDCDNAIDDGDVTVAQQQFGMAPTAGVPAMLSWTGNDAVAGGAGTWSTAGLAWRGAVTDASLAIPLVPGARAQFSGAGVSVTVSGSVLVAGGIDCRSTGVATFTGSGGTFVLGGTAAGANEIAVADGSQAFIAVGIAGANGLVKTGPGRLTLTAGNSYAGTTIVSGGTLAVGNSGPTGSVPGAIRIDSGAALALNRTGVLTLAAAISGSGSVAQIGSGSTVMTVANSHLGQTSVQAGTLRVEHPGALASSPTVVTGGRLEVAAGVTLRAPSVTLSGGVLSGASLLVGGTGIGALVIDGGTVIDSPSLTVAGGGVVSLPSSRQVTLGVRALSMDGGTGGGRLEVGAGLVTVAAGGIAPDAVLAAVLAGRGDGSWNGSAGVTSAAVAAAQASGLSRAVGWAVNPDGSLVFGFAAPGDTNLDGVLDVLDVSDLLAADKNDKGTPAVWQDGDFNYDGIVDSLDIAEVLGSGLFDIGSYHPVAAAVVAVPEPGGWGLAAAGAVLTAATVLRRGRHTRHASARATAVGLDAAGQRPHIRCLSVGNARRHARGALDFTGGPS